MNEYENRNAEYNKNKKRESNKEKCLMHTCCAPCSIYCIEKLEKENISFDLYWYNPNIHPYTEYEKRRDTLIDYANKLNIKLILNENNNFDEFIQIQSKDLSKRCEDVCYRIRLEETAKEASKLGYFSYTTTLLVSPYQNTEKIVEIGKEYAEKYNIKFLEKDFLLGFREGQNKARELKMYMQNYCGCIFSEFDRYRKKINKFKIK